MRAALALLAWTMSGGIAWSAPEVSSARRAPEQAAPSSPLSGQEPRIVVAQACGWYAILGCFRSPGEANRWTSRIDYGYVISTTSEQFPNFRPGYYCVVNGPTSRGRAQRIAAGWRDVVPDAYVKNAC